MAALSDADGSADFMLPTNEKKGKVSDQGSITHGSEHYALLDKEYGNFEKITVKTLTYNTLIETYGIKEVNLFVLDVEGHELQVLRGMKGCPVIPRVMCIESDKIPKVELDSLMGSLGFRADSVFRNNTIFVREL